MLRNLSLPLAFLVALSTVAFAQPRQQMGRAPAERGRETRLADDLKLTEKQEKEMQKLRLDMEKKQTQIQSQIRVQRLEMQGLFQEDKPDRAAIEKIQKNISDLELQAKLAKTDHWFAVQSILTPDQQKVWRKHVGRFGEGRGQFMGDRQRRRMIIREYQSQGDLPEEENEN